MRCAHSRSLFWIYTVRSNADGNRELLQSGCCSVIGSRSSVLPNVLPATPKEKKRVYSQSEQHQQCFASEHKHGVALQQGSVTHGLKQRANHSVTTSTTLYDERMAVRGRHILCLAGESCSFIAFAYGFTRLLTLDMVCSGRRVSLYFRRFG